MDSHYGNKVFLIKDIDEFISSIQSECIKDVLDGVSVTFFGKAGKFNDLLEDDDVVKSFLPTSVVENEIEKYIFSTTLHTDNIFIRPDHIELTIREISEDIFDSVMLKLADHNILEICWYKEDFMWRIKPIKMV